MDEEGSRPRCTPVAGIEHRGCGVAQAATLGLTWCKRCAIDLFQAHSSLMSDSSDGMHESTGAAGTADDALPAETIQVR